MKTVIFILLAIGVLAKTNDEETINNKLAEEIEMMKKEASEDATLKLTNDMKLKLKDPDTANSQSALIEMHVFDLIYEKYKLEKEDVQQIIKENPSLKDSHKTNPI